MRILLGTNNKGKVTEISECLGHLPIELVTPNQLDVKFLVPEETGMTFVENASLKAKHYHGISQLPTIADDSGIIIDALQGELGVETRRWGAGPEASDEEWIEFFLKRMKEEDNKKARFVCTIAHIDNNGELHIFEGTCEGTITDELEADYLPGLPISACFKPDGCDYVYSGMPISEKNRVSHRGRALQALEEHLRQSI